MREKEFPPIWFENEVAAHYFEGNAWVFLIQEIYDIPQVGCKICSWKEPNPPPDHWELVYIHFLENHKNELSMMAMKTG